MENGPAHIPPNQRANHRITAAQFAAKYKSKRECYNFLAIDVGAYLPAYDTITIYFLKDLVSGKKKSKCINFHILPFVYVVIKSSRISHLSIP